MKQESTGTNSDIHRVQKFWEMLGAVGTKKLDRVTPLNLEMRRPHTCWEVSLSAPWPRSGLGDVSRAMWVTRAGVGGEKFDAMEAPWSPDSPGAPLVSVGKQFL